MTAFLDTKSVLTAKVESIISMVLPIIKSFYTNYVENLRGSGYYDCWKIYLPLVFISTIS